MKRNICTIITMILFFHSCSNHKDKNVVASIDYTNLIFSIDVDSVDNLDANWRQSFVMIRFVTKNEPNGGSPILMMSNKKGVFFKESGRKKWIPIEDFPNDTNLNKDKIIYAYDLMTKYPIRRIHKLWKENALFVNFDSCSYIHTTNMDIINLYKATKLDKDWWLLKPELILVILLFGRHFQ